MFSKGSYLLIGVGVTLILRQYYRRRNFIKKFEVELDSSSSKDFVEVKYDDNFDDFFEECDENYSDDVELQYEFGVEWVDFYC